MPRKNDVFLVFTSLSPCTSWIFTNGSGDWTQHCRLPEMMKHNLAISHLFNFLAILSDSNSPIHPSIHPFIYPLTHPSIYSLIHLLTHPSIHLPIHLLTHLSIHHPFTHYLSNLFISTHHPTHSSIYLATHTSLHP